jgi:hypothetical protein
LFSSNSDEVFEYHVGNGARASIRFQHKHLVTRPGVDVSVRDMRHSSISAKRSHSTPARPIAINIFHQDVLGWRFYSDAFVLVGYHNIVDPNVGAPDVYAVETSFVAAADGHVVDLAVCAGVDGEVEGGGVD